MPKRSKRGGWRRGRQCEEQRAGVNGTGGPSLATLPRATAFSRSWPLLNAKPVGTRPSRDVAFGINATIPLRYDPVAKALAALLILKLHLHGRSTGARALWGKKNQDQYEGVHGPSSGPPLCLPVKSSESIDRLSHLGPNRHAGMEC